MEITEHYIDIKKVLESKGITKVSPLAVRFLNRLLHVEELNRDIYANREYFGIDFATQELKSLGVRMEVQGAERIPVDGNPIIAGNHPLGGPDGMALVSVVGQVRSDVLFPVNDFLLHVPGLRDVFVPIDKVHRNTSNVSALEAAFAGNNALLYFPAGLCSRRTNGVICDTDWKPTFIKKARQYGRDVVPVYVDAHNRRRFYTIANLRKRLGVKFNFEMALLPGEMFAQRGNTFRVVFGQPIPHSVFDERHTPQQWAQMVKSYVYELGKNPDAQFNVK
ncbi:MAG: glycerol acyltransferase [Bacteroidales bacterium]|nr:glycerol acyltransferase [Bacteroidales bacterium]